MNKILTSIQKIPVMHLITIMYFQNERLNECQSSMLTVREGPMTRIKVDPCEFEENQTQSDSPHSEV